ncbi:hypothetical protein PanWU01x14_194230 [Parasponia andersonii]|uniref:Uncharacterized protein n=1 Tax=Parasponia andersonii TaxID=3476 RepID=A0A2P5C0K1_PARAD|nr:hypothetical protein PanWU01x14_194230 [Parasponia andersonii]
MVIILKGLIFKIRIYHIREENIAHLKLRLQRDNNK